MFLRDQRLLPMVIIEITERAKQMPKVAKKDVKTLLGARAMTPTP